MSNSNNSVNNNNSASENREDFRKKEERQDRFLKDFTKHYYLNNQTQRNNRLDTLFSATSLDSIGVKDEMERFYEGNKTKYNGEVSLDEITLYALKFRLNTSYTKLNYKRQNLKELILKDFELSQDSDLRRLNNDLIDNSDDKRLDTLLDKKEKREEAVKNIFPDIGKKEHFMIDFLSKFSINKDFSKLKTNEKLAILNFYDDSKRSLVKIDREKIDKLFETNLLTQEQKQEIIAFYFPVMSIAELRSFGVNVDNALQQERDRLCSETWDYLNFTSTGLTEQELRDRIREDIEVYIDEKELKVDTADFFRGLSNDDFNKIVDNIDFEEFAGSYNSNIEAKSGSLKKEDFEKKISEEYSNKVKWDLLGGNNLGGKIDKGLYVGIEFSGEGNQQSEKVFYKIESLIDGGFSSISLGSPGVDLTKTETKPFYFQEFDNLLSDGVKKGGMQLDVKSCTFMDFESLQKKIKDGEIERVHSEKTTKEQEIEEETLKLQEEINKNDQKLIDFASKDSEIADISFKLIELNRELEDTSLREGKKGELENKIKELQEEYDEKIKEIKDKLSNGEIPSTLKLLEEEEKEISNINKEINNSFDKIDDLEKFLYKNEGGEKEFNKDSFKKVLDEIDSQGEKYGFDEGISFVTKQGAIFSIPYIIEDHLTVQSPFGVYENIPFTLFLEKFKDLDCKRIAKEIPGENIVDGIRGDNSIDSDLLGFWQDIEFKNDKLVKKKNDKTIELDCLQSTDSNELIKIDSISGDKAIVSFGEFKKDSKTDKVKEVTMFSNESKMEVSLSWLKAWIKNEKAKPVNLDGKDQDKLPNSKKRKWGVASWFMNGLSISEIIGGGKILIDTVEGSLKQGGEEHSAKFANKFGWLLGEEIKAEMQSKVEESQKKRAEDIFNKLSVLDSGPATKLIKKWLLDKNTPQYKIEAGLKFMFSKYGVLYGKSGLKEYRGSFLWYEALGGEIGDKIYMEEKEKAESEGQVFTEEALVMSLLIGYQCKALHKIKRRSKFGKEMVIDKINGKKSDAEGGAAENKTLNTVEERVSKSIEELEAGNYPNAMGRLPEVLNKGGSMKILNKIPFVMIFSGEAYTYEKESLQELSNYPYNSQLLPMFSFAKDKTKTELLLLNRTILEVCNRLDQQGVHKGIHKEALSIFNNQESNSLKTEKKVQETSKFYDQYGEIITEILYGLNTGKTDSNSHLSKMIFMEKDNYEDKDGNKVKGNAIFKSYYDFLSGISPAYKWENEELMSDAFAGKGTSGINIRKAASTLLTWTSDGSYRKKDAGPLMWLEITKEIEAIKQRDYGIYGNNGKQKDMQNFLKGLMIGLLEASGTNFDRLCSNTSPVGNQFKKWGVDISKIKNYSYIELENGSADNIISDFTQSILNGGYIVKSNDDWLINSMESTRNAANDAMYDNDQKEAA